MTTTVWVVWDKIDTSRPSDDDGDFMGSDGANTFFLLLPSFCAFPNPVQLRIIVNNKINNNHQSSGKHYWKIDMWRPPTDEIDTRPAVGQLYRDKRMNVNLSPWSVTKMKIGNATHRSLVTTDGKEARVIYLHVSWWFTPCFSWIITERSSTLSERGGEKDLADWTAARIMW